MRKTCYFLLILVFLMSSAVLLTSGQSEDEKFQKFLDSYFDAFWKFYPSLATVQGYHKYDNKLEDLGKGNIEKRHDSLDKFNQELVAKIDSAGLSPDLQIDHAMMVDGLDRELIKHENLLPWEYNPLFYNQILNTCVRSLFAKDSAPGNAQTKNTLERLKAIPKLIKQAKENLKTPPQLYTETAIAQFPAILNFYQTGLSEMIEGTSDPNKSKLLAELTKVVKELTVYKDFLSNELLPRSTGNFRLAEAHRRLVRTTFQNSIPLVELISRAKADENNIRREMVLVCIPFFKIMYPEINPDQLGGTRSEAEVRNIIIKGVFDKIKGDHVTKEQFFSQIETIRADIKEFIQTHQIVDLPQNNLKIDTIPEVSRGLTWTNLVTSGIYETTEEYICQISTLPEGLDEGKITSFLEEYNNYYLPFYTCRKVYPGQFVPLFYTRKNPSFVRKMYPNMPLIKGWPILVEEMLINAGYGNYDLRMRLSQLKHRLKVVMDFNLDFNIHEGGMTKEQGMAYMTRGGYQTEAEAERNWIRTILNPGDTSYAYVGLQEILDMEKDYRQLKGDSYSRKEFLNKVLSFGALPLRQLKKKLSQ